MCKVGSACTVLLTRLNSTAAPSLPQWRRRKVSGIMLPVFLWQRMYCICLFQVKQEWELHSSLSHPNIIKSYLAFEDADGVKMFMEYAGDSDAYSFISNKQRLSLREQDACQLVYDVLTALKFMHSQVGEVRLMDLQLPINTNLVRGWETLSLSQARYSSMPFCSSNAQAMTWQKCRN